MSSTTVIDALDVRDLLGLVDHVCRARGVTREEVCGRGRTKAVALARHELWWRLRHHPEMSFSYVEIGRLFDRHHTSVFAGIRAHERASASHVTEVRSTARFD